MSPILALLALAPVPAVPITPGTPLPSLAPLVERLKPVVVSIRTSSATGDDEHAPARDFFHRFFGGGEDNDHEQMQRQRSLGSGFIWNGHGNVVTNYHVVKGATDVRIKLADGREFPAEVVGRDPKTDLALLRLRGPSDLPVARLGDSDRLRVGDWVIAIGNPFGLGHTVTSGIVSAKERFFGAGPYDDFIQTDASINPGNSGGAIFNANGEVVGVAAAIVQGGQGIGFAIPINIVKNVVAQLETHGNVVRGWIGVGIQEVTPELAKGFHLPKAEGALISSMDRRGPAAQAGLQPGDVVVEWNGKPVKDSTRLPLLVAETLPGSKASAVVLRKEDRRAVTITVGTLHEREERKEVSGREEPGPAKPPGAQGGKLGFEVETMSSDLARRLDLPSVRGALVVGVQSDGPADSVLEPGDVIFEQDGKPVPDAKTLHRLIANRHSGDVVLLRFRRGDQVLYAGLTVR